MKCADVIGLDVARWQGTATPWRELETKHEVRFAICKATHGLSGVDSTYQINRSAILETGISLGAYHWLLPKADGREQARRFVDAAGDFRPGDVGYAVDFEDHQGLRGAALLDPLLACLEEIAALTGRTAIVYTGRWFWSGFVGLDSEAIARYPLWHAQYPRTARDTRSYREAVCALPSDPDIASPWASRGIKEAIWQFDGDGGLYLPNGVDVDVNRFRGDEAAFRAFVAQLSAGRRTHLTVREAQERLAALGHDPGPIDSKWGPRTKAAVEAHQRARNLESSGVLDAATVQSLIDDYAALEVIELEPDPRGPAPLDAREVITSIFGAEHGNT